MLVCELEPGGPAAVGGPVDVVLTVEEPARPSAFHVHGSTTLSGFVFVVQPRDHGHPGRILGGGCWLTHHSNPISAQEPTIRTLHPPFGPQGGGTYLSLHGTNLLAGSSWQVMVNGSECPLAWEPRYGPVLLLPGTAVSLAQGQAWGPPAVLLSSPATAAVSPGRVMGRSGAWLLLLVAWAQPGWPCGSMGRSSQPLCSSSTVPTPPCRPSPPAAALSECMRSLPQGQMAPASTPSWPGWMRCWRPHAPHGPC